MKQDIITIQSRHCNGGLMFPGRWRRTWVRFGGCWMLVEMEALD